MRRITEALQQAGLEKDALVIFSSDNGPVLDDVLIIDNAGVLKIVRIQDKFFAGKNPLYISVIKKGDGVQVVGVVLDVLNEKGEIVQENLDRAQQLVDQRRQD